MGMTVGDLRGFLEAYPDGMDIGVIDSDGVIVSATIVEDGDSELYNPHEFLVVCPVIEKRQD